MTTIEDLTSLEVESMQPFSKVKVDRSARGGSIISWQLVPNTKLGISHFAIYFVTRGYSELDYIDSTEEYFITDPERRSYSHMKSGGYLILLHTEEGKVYQSKVTSIPSSWTNKDFIYAGEATRRANQFYSTTGSKFILLHRKWAGSYCNECYDEQTGEVTNPLCESCYGTRFEGGYYTPVEIGCRFAGIQSHLTEGGGKKEQVASIQTYNAPFIEPYDIVIMPELDKRAEVLDANAIVSVGGYPLELNISGRIIEESSPIYKFDISETLTFEG